jgi:hypothetical protein
VKDYLSLAFRGWLIVTLTSLNTGQIAGHHWTGAGMVGFGISWVWWKNAQSAAKKDLPWIGEVYALGAATGTLTGMLIHSLLYKP